MSNPKKVLVFTATYNEKENVELLISSVFKNSPEVNVYKRAKVGIRYCS